MSLGEPEVRVSVAVRSELCCCLSAIAASAADPTTKPLASTTTVSRMNRHMFRKSKLWRVLEKNWEGGERVKPKQCRVERHVAPTAVGLEWTACKGRKRVEKIFCVRTYPVSKIIQPVSQSQKCGPQEKSRSRAVSRTDLACRQGRLCGAL